jgi:hypothetical protein
MNTLPLAAPKASEEEGLGMEVPEKLGQDARCPRIQTARPSDRHPLPPPPPLRARGGGPDEMEVPEKLGQDARCAWIHTRRPSDRHPRSPFLLRRRRRRRRKGRGWRFRKSSVRMLGALGSIPVRRRTAIHALPSSCGAEGVGGGRVGDGGSGKARSGCSVRLDPYPSAVGPPPPAPSSSASRKRRGSGGFSGKADSPTCCTIGMCETIVLGRERRGRFGF